MHLLKGRSVKILNIFIVKIKLQFTWYLLLDVMSVTGVVLIDFNAKQLSIVIDFQRPVTPQMTKAINTLES